MPSTSRPGKVNRNLPAVRCDVSTFQAFRSAARRGLEAEPPDPESYCTTCAVSCYSSKGRDSAGKFHEAGWGFACLMTQHVHAVSMF